VAAWLRRLVVPAVLAALAALLLLPGLWVGPSLDASIFSVVGWRLTEGDVLYAEVWDHEPPGAYLPYALAHLGTDSPDIAWAIVWLASVVSIVAAALMVRAVLIRSRGFAGADAGALLLVFGAAAYLTSLGGGMSETFALLPLAAALAAAVAGRWLLAGVTAGLAIVVSLQSAPVLAALVTLSATGAPSQAILRRTPFVLAGAAVVAAATTIVLWLGASLPSAVDALIGYSAAYRQVTSRTGGASAFALVPWTVLVLLPLLVAIGLAAVNRRRLVGARLASASAVWVATGVALILFQGRFYAHYASPLVIPLALVGGLGLDAAWRTAKRRRFLLIGAPLLIAAGFALVIGAVGARQEQRPILDSNRRAEAVAERLVEQAGPDASIFVWGNDARIYEIARLRPALRYVYLYPLLTPGYVTEGLVARLVAELEQSPPLVIVDSGSSAPGQPGLPMLLEPRPLATDGRDFDLLGPIRDVIAHRYHQSAVVEGWPLYVASSTARPS
jgi:hypothetical protein